MEIPKKPLISFFLIIFLSFSVFGLHSYTKLGGENSDYVLDGNGIFNGGLTLTSFNYETRSISQPRKSPLVSDIDNDGINEILVLDGYDLRLFSGNALDIVDSISLPSDDHFSNIEIYDIDGDSLQEIILAAEGSERIYIYEFNGSLFRQQKNISFSHLADSDNGETLIRCETTDRCLLIYSEQRTNDGSTACISAATFSTTATLHRVSVECSAADRLFCLPKIRSMPYEDYDNDGEREFIFSYIDASETGNEEIHFAMIHLNASANITIEGYYEKQIQNVVTDTALDCADSVFTDRPGDYITSPLVVDVDGSVSNGMEIIIGAQYDQDEFKIYWFDKNGVMKDDYPEITQADGFIMSNPMLINAFPDTDREDFCVLGFVDDTESINLLCGSILTGELVHTNEYEYDVTGRFNISKTYDKDDVLTHVTSQTHTTTDGNDLDEIVNSYGVFEIDNSGTNTLNQIFENPKNNGSALMLNIMGGDYTDLLVLTNTNLWYIDDGFSNSPAELDLGQLNPCRNYGAWQNSTQVRLLATVTDPDGDDVSAQAILYYGESYNQTSSWIGGASGTVFTFDFIANVTTVDGLLKVYANDTENPAVFDSESITFQVATTGTVYGYCLETFDWITTQENETVPLVSCNSDTDCPNYYNCQNAVCVSYSTEEIIDEILPPDVVPEGLRVLIGLALVAAAWFGTIIYLKDKGITNGTVLIYAPIFIAILVFIVTVVVGLIETWLLLVLILFASAAIGYKFYKDRNIIIG